MAFDSETNSRNLTVLIGDNVEVLISFHTVDTDELSVNLKRHARSSGECYIITSSNGSSTFGGGDCSDSHSCSFVTSDVNNRHQGFFNDRSTGILTQICVLINLGLDFRRDEVCESTSSNCTSDSRLHEGDLSTSDTNFVKSLGHVRKSLERSVTRNYLESLVDSLFDTILFDRTSELDTARLCNFVSEGFNVIELIPCIEFDGSVLVLKGHVNFNFADCIRRSFETVVNFTRSRNVHGVILSVLFAFQFGLGHVGVGLLNIGDVIIDFPCDKLGLVVVAEGILVACFDITFNHNCDFLLLN